MNHRSTFTRHSLPQPAPTPAAHMPRTQETAASVTLSSRAHAMRAAIWGALFIAATLTTGSAIDTAWQQVGQLAQFESTLFALLGGTFALCALRICLVHALAIAALSSTTPRVLKATSIGVLRVLSPKTAHYVAATIGLSTTALALSLAPGGATGSYEPAPITAEATPASSAPAATPSELPSATHSESQPNVTSVPTPSASQSVASLPVSPTLEAGTSIRAGSATAAGTIADPLNAANPNAVPVPASAIQPTSAPEIGWHTTPENGATSEQTPGKINVHMSIDNESASRSVGVSMGGSAAQPESVATEVSPTDTIREPSPGSNSAHTTAGEAHSVEYTVNEGDSLWSIAAHSLDPQNRTDAQIDSLVQATIALNPDIENPDLIYPGQVLQLPKPQAPTPAAAQ